MSSTTRRCPPGQIQRVAYQKQSGTRVPAACITDRGLPGKTPASQRIPVSREDDLGRFGYQGIRKMAAPQRHEALVKAAEAYGALAVYRKLNALMVLNRNTVPTVSDIFRRDRDWLGKRYGYGTKASKS